MVLISEITYIIISRIREETKGKSIQCLECDYCDNKCPPRHSDRHLVA